MRFSSYDPYNWHRWFAWRPVKTGGTIYWFEIIERKWIAGLDTGWIYRPTMSTRP